MNATALPASLQLNGPGDSRVDASAFGAHVLSWRCRGRERLYLSPNPAATGRTASRPRWTSNPARTACASP